MVGGLPSRIVTSVLTSCSARKVAGNGFGPLQNESETSAKIFVEAGVDATLMEIAWAA